MKKLFSAKMMILAASVPMLGIGVFLYLNNPGLQTKNAQIARVEHVARPLMLPDPKPMDTELKSPVIGKIAPRPAELSSKELSAGEVSPEASEIQKLIEIAENKVASSEEAMKAMNNSELQQEIPENLREKIASLPVTAQYLIHLAMLFPDRSERR